MSTVRVVDGGNTSLTADAITPSMASWRALYRLRSRATEQLLRTWRSVWFFLQSVHAGLSFFFQRNKLELCGSMSTAALRANFISDSGSDWTTEAQIEALFW